MALYEAAERGRPFRTQPVSVTLDGEARQVSLSVHPATGAEMSGFVLIIFLEADDMAESGDKEQVGQATAVAVRELELELARTKERLQTTVEEFESSREEMRASNEELQSMNEELHSTAEELETSKEELQSINEELLTVNQEHRNKVEELSQLSGDLQNLLASSEVATLFLDRELCIRRFTPQVGELFNIMEADQGRPLSHITHKLEGNSLLRDAKGVLEKLTMIEREMRGLDDRHFLVRLRPYRSLEDRIDGVVIIFVNVTKMKQTEEQLRASNQFQQDIVHTVREGLLVLDLNLRVEFANESFYQMFEVPMTETEGTLVYELGNGQWDIPELRILLEDVLPDNTVFNDYEMTHEFEHIGKRIMRLNGRRLDGQQRILLAVEDITERQQALHELQQLTNKLETEVAQRTSRIRELASELLVAEQNVRQRIAEALHDDLQQFLYSMRMQLGMLKNTLTAEGKTEAAAPIEELDEMIQAAFKMTRQMAGELQPPVPVGEKLGESMRQLAAYIHELHLLEVDVTLHDDVTLPDENTRLLLFHIVRELLFNVVKHAAVDSARLEVKQEENMLKVSVRDAGKGFDAEGFLKNSKRTSLGLYSINERLKLLNGRIEIHSIVGDGTRVDIFIPLY